MIFKKNNVSRRCGTYIQWNISHKKDKTMPFVATEMDPEIITLSEINQTEKDKYNMICGI